MYQPAEHALQKWSLPNAADSNQDDHRAALWHDAAYSCSDEIRGAWSNAGQMRRLQYRRQRGESDQMLRYGGNRGFKNKLLTINH